MSKGFPFPVPRQLLLTGNGERLKLISFRIFQAE
jgi:hypothetical protein